MTKHIPNLSAHAAPSATVPDIPNPALMQPPQRFVDSDKPAAFWAAIGCSEYAAGVSPGKAAAFWAAYSSLCKMDKSDLCKLLSNITLVRAQTAPAASNSPSSIRAKA
tara:strand:- start:319 stop:642 length:324 start_codon:yes stop_codon:yes gene_type:complete